MSAPAVSFLILGLTRDGKTFRPSDWVERLCGIMSQFTPDGSSAQGHLAYSPYVIPTVHAEQKCVRVDARLLGLEPLAYKFVEGFCRDNNLQTVVLDQ